MSERERTAAAEALERASRRTVLLVGFETDTCVAQSAVGLQDLGYRTGFIEEATYPTGELEHHHRIARMAGSRATSRGRAGASSR